MPYKVVGYVVWRGAKWYLRRRYPGTRRKLAVATVGGALVAGVLAAARQHGSDET